MPNGGTPVGPTLGTPKTVVLNPNEQWVSKDFNDAQLFIGAELTDWILRTLANDQQGFTGTVNAIVGVISGLDASVLVATSPATIRINAGLAFYYGAGTAQPADGSLLQWMKLPAGQNVGLTANGAANPVWSLIYATPANVAGAGQSLVKWDPTQNGGAGAAVLFTAPKRQDPTVTLGVVQGTAAAAPALPATPAGSIPICYILQPASGGSLGATGANNPNLQDARTVVSPGKYGQHGVVQGLCLNYDNGGFTTGNSSGLVQLSRGKCYIDGHPITLTADLTGQAVRATSTVVYVEQSAVGGAANMAASTVYYAYIVANTAGTPTAADGDVTQSLTTGAGFSIVCSTTPPTMDGHPSAAIHYPIGSTWANGVGGGLPTTTSALFIGSLLADPGGNLVPFNRCGDEVLLVTTATWTNPICQQVFNSGGVNVPAAGSFGTSVPFPKSAPGGASPLIIIDVNVLSAEATAKGWNFYDPKAFSYTIPVAITGRGVMSFILNATGVNFPTTTRIKVRLDQSAGPTGPKIWTGPATGAAAVNTTITSQYVGYVEPLSRMFT